MSLRSISMIKKKFYRSTIKPSKIFSDNAFRRAIERNDKAKKTNNGFWHTL